MLMHWLVFFFKLSAMRYLTSKLSCARTCWCKGKDGLMTKLKIEIEVRGKMNKAMYHLIALVLIK